MNLIGEFCLVNLIGFVKLFMDSNCLGGSGRMSVDSLGFRGRIGVDFCWIRKISLDSCRDGNIFGWVWEDLDGFERLSWDLGGFGWIWLGVDF